VEPIQKPFDNQDIVDLDTIQQETALSTKGKPLRVSLHLQSFLGPHYMR
jgi:hypothetical protein